MNMFSRYLFSFTSGVAGRVHRYYVHPNQARDSLNGDAYGLAEPESALLTLTQYDEDTVLCGAAGGDLGSVRPTKYFQYESGSTI